MYKVLVLLAAHNGARFITDQIESIGSQVGVSIKILINVDKSTDLTEKLVSELCINNPNIMHMPFGYASGSSGSNFYKLIDSASVYYDIDDFDYISFSDQDDIWFNNKISRAIECLNKSGSSGYSSNITAFWTSSKTVLIRKDFPVTCCDFYHESSGPGCTFVLTKDLFKCFNTYISSNKASRCSFLAHDWLIYAFARYNCYAWFKDDFSSMYYRQHDSNVAGANSGFKALFKRFRSFLIWYKPYVYFLKEEFPPRSKICLSISPRYMFSQRTTIGSSIVVYFLRVFRVLP